MKYRLFFLLVFLLPLTLSSQPPSQDKTVVLLMKDGSQLKGKIVNKYITKIKIRNEDGLQIVKRNHVESIIKLDLFNEILNNGSTSKDLFVFKNKEWVALDIEQITNKFILVSDDDGLRNILVKDVLEIYPACQVINTTVDLSNAKENVFSNQLFIPKSKKDKPKRILHKRGWFNTSHIELLYPKSNFIQPVDVMDLENVIGNGELLRRTKLQNGIGVSNVTGYSFNNLLSIGLGLGYFDYTLGLELDARTCTNCGVLNVYIPDVIPVFVEIRGDLLKRKISPYYSLSLGVANSFYSSEFRNMRSTSFENFIARGFDVRRRDFKPKPGLFFNPTLGVNFKLNSMNLLAGVSMQMVNINQLGRVSVRNDNVEFNYDQYKIRSLSFKIGIML